MNNNKLPGFLKQYFWDVDFNSLDKSAYPKFIIKRVLDRGDTRAIHWLLKEYSQDSIRNVIKESRDISARTVNFWALFLNISPSEILCLQKPYSRTPFGLSS